MRKQYINLFWQLLKTDFYIYKQTVIDHFVNMHIWVVCTVIVSAYIFPLLGMSKEFGAFFAVGSISGSIFWSTWYAATDFVSDIEGNKTINYFLILPLPNTLELIRQIVSYALKAGIPALILLPLSKLLLQDRMSLCHFSFFKFFFIYSLIAVFVGAFSLFIVSFIKDIHHVSNVGMRFLFPLWFFSGTNNTWKLLFSLSTPLAYLSLANPLLYAMEGIRAAVLGQTEYINFWICTGMLFLFTLLFGWLGIRRLRKRLDFV